MSRVIVVQSMLDEWQMYLGGRGRSLVLILRHSFCFHSVVVAELQSVPIAIVGAVREEQGTFSGWVGQNGNS